MTDNSPLPAPGQHSVLLLGFGQSNADVHDAGPRLNPEIENALPIFMPNDGKMIRGYMGGKRLHPISGFDHVERAPGKIQSLLVAAAARFYSDLGDDTLKRVIVRSEARGGRRFLGFKNGDVVVDGIHRDHDGTPSIIFRNLLATLEECIQAAEDDGCPIRRVYVVWLHGESDRAMDRQTYIAHFLDLRSEVEDRLRRTGVDLRWSLVQASGTGSRGGGNSWPNRMSLIDLADSYENIDLVLAAYPYEQIDGSHFSGRGKQALGENLGRVLAAIHRGESVVVPRPIGARQSGSDILLDFRTRDPIVLDDESLPPSETTVRGFHTHDRNHARLLRVETDGDDCLRLCFDRSPDPATLQISYAYQHNRRGDPSADSMFPVGRGCLRTAYESASIYAPDVRLHDWAVGFSLAFRDLANGPQGSEPPSSLPQPTDRTTRA